MVGADEEGFSGGEEVGRPWIREDRPAGAGQVDRGPGARGVQPAVRDPGADAARGGELGDRFRIIRAHLVPRDGAVGVLEAACREHVRVGESGILRASHGAQAGRAAGRLVRREPAGWTPFGIIGV